MASNFYDKHLPDYGDLDNRTGACPGFRLRIVENDGGIGISMQPINDSLDPLTLVDSHDPNEGRTEWYAFLNVSEAQELLNGLQKAINRAAPKRANHRDRVQEPPIA